MEGGSRPEKGRTGEAGLFLKFRIKLEGKGEKGAIFFLRENSECDSGNLPRRPRRREEPLCESTIPGIRRQLCDTPSHGRN